MTARRGVIWGAWTLLAIPSIIITTAVAVFVTRSKP